MMDNYRIEDAMEDMFDLMDEGVFDPEQGMLCEYNFEDDEGEE